VRRPIADPHWGAQVRALYEHDLREIWDPRIAPQVWNQHHNQLETCLSVVGAAMGLRILDVGCAQGTLALLLGERGHEVWAVDIRQEFLDYAASRHERGRVHFVRGDALDLQFAEQFDVIFANQVVEHIVYPGRLFASARRLLTPGGRLVVTTPNYDYVKNALPSFCDLGDASQHAWRQHSADGDGHFFAYRGRELRALLHEAGFRSVHVGCFETPIISGHLKVRHAHRAVPVRVLRALDRALLRVPVLGWKMSHQLLAVAS
jgi:2-polyprenyl-3-methyl-5-hydroxy-6-metoxy-1,4-benzoquinol methylase